MIAPRLRRLISSYPELIAVLLAAVAGLSIRAPLEWLTSHQGINVLLAILVFATATTIGAGSLRQVVGEWRVLVKALAAGVTVLPAASWLASRVVTAGSLRDGVMAVGIAPCEIASVATTTMAGGEAALSAGVLIGSTVATVAVAGPILSLEAGGATIHPGHIVINLALVVALPLAAGLALRAAKPTVARAERAATTISVASVAALVALIAAEIHFSVAYLGVFGALALFLAASGVVGKLIGRNADRASATAVLLTTSMRDFAIAAGIVSSAFGSRAAAPLGLYGVMVLVWGTAIAGRSRRRAVGAAAEATASR